MYEPQLFIGILSLVAVSLLTSVPSAYAQTATTQTHKGHTGDGNRKRVGA
jgi:hypothetical protein